MCSPWFRSAIIGAVLLVINLDHLINFARFRGPIGTKVGMNVSAVLLLGSLFMTNNSIKFNMTVQAALLQLIAVKVSPRQGGFWYNLYLSETVAVYASALVLRQAIYAQELDGM